MPSIAVVANASLSATWAGILCADGHEVETFSNVFECGPLFTRDRLDILIIDIENPNFGEAMLIPQCRARWPDCKIIVAVAGYTFRSSAVFRMGLWEPDQLLVQPVRPKVLLGTVSYLWSRTRAEKIREAVTAPALAPSGRPLAELPAVAPAGAPDGPAPGAPPARVAGASPLAKT